MSLITDALKSFADSRNPQPKQCPTNYDNAKKLLDDVYEELTTVQGQSELLWKIQTEGGTHWTYKFVENNAIYDEVACYQKDLVRTLDIKGFEGAVLYLDNGEHPTKMLLSYPPRRPLVTFVRVSISTSSCIIC
jgi:hypothetical protein